MNYRRFGARDARCTGNNADGGFLADRLRDHTIGVDGCGLFFTLVGVAGLYAFIGADFLAALQILIYVGGVLVLVIFGAMLTRRSSGTVRLRASGPPWVPLAGSLCMFLFLCTGIAKYDWNSVSTVAKREPGGLTRAIGEMLMTKYMLPFEVTSVALLAVIVAAAYLARRDEPDHPAGETK
jgi:NADH:ubiquinone oxidoreductase subunit 6 (subunit J)